MAVRQTKPHIPFILLQPGNSLLKHKQNPQVQGSRTAWTQPVAGVTGSSMIKLNIDTLKKIQPNLSINKILSHLGNSISQ